MRVLKAVIQALFPGLGESIQSFTIKYNISWFFFLMNLLDAFYQTKKPPRYSCFFCEFFKKSIQDDESIQGVELS